MSQNRRITSSRLGRLSLLGRLAGGMAGSAASEGVRQLLKGRRPSIEDVFLTPKNMNRVADKLSEMRGAAMKLGQLMSMDSGQVLPEELTNLLEKLRDSAHHMPLGQVAKVLKASWGDKWDKNFTRFNFTPIAAASIGQVHEAELKDGRKVAIKIQYPGIRASIDSDVSNVATLLKALRLLPKDLDVDNLLVDAKDQLHAEADYGLEAQSLKNFSLLLQEDNRFRLPDVVDELCSSEVLTMSFMEGSPIDDLKKENAELKNKIAHYLTELAFREVFEWGVAQTDPNFANYLYTPSGIINLLDFGATRSYSQHSRDALKELLQACYEADDRKVAAAAQSVGYLADEDSNKYEEMIVNLLKTATEPLRAAGLVDFKDLNLAQKMSDQVVEMRVNQGFGRLPPTEILFLHRKLGGLYLLLTKINACIDVEAIAKPYLSQASTTEKSCGNNNDD